MSTAAAQHAREAEKRRKKTEYQRKWRAEHRNEIAAKRKAAKELQKAEASSEYSKLINKLYSNPNRVCCIVAERYSDDTIATVEFRPYEPLESAFLVRVKRSGKLIYSFFSSFDEARAFCRKMRVGRLKKFRNLFQESL